MTVAWKSGDAVPHFVARSTNNKAFHFDVAAGRYLVVSFFGSTDHPQASAALRHILSRREVFDDQSASFFGVCTNPEDESSGRIKALMPGIRYFWDFDRKVSLLYGALATPETPDSDYQGFTLLLDPMQRVMAAFSMADADQHNAAYDAALAALPPINEHAGTQVPAPVLVLPRVFEPEFCRELIGYYERHGGEDSGFMRQIGDKTVPVLDHSFKSRKDFNFDSEPEYESLRATIRTRIAQRLIPQIHKVFQFEVTRIERYTVSCYEAQAGGFFRAHRDNTTTGTAHRRFACSFNLNAEDYEGGDLRLPEFGTQTYRAPTGGVTVFSCSLLHEATRVTKGTRYAFLPFLYDDAAALIRRQNLHAISDEMINRNQDRT